MISRNTPLLHVVFAALAFIVCARTASCDEHLLRKTADEILRNRIALAGKDYKITGFARFDPLSKRGFLYRNLRELRRHDRERTIFLQLDLDKFWTHRIPDEAYVLVTGYLAEELHGPLGSYPAHVVVNAIEVAKEPLHHRKEQ